MINRSVLITPSS